MTRTRTVWREVQRRHRAPLLRYFDERRCRTTGAADLAAKLTSFLITSIQTPQHAAAFWRAVPAVLDRCDDLDTYRLDMAPEAYAWVHLLDRYVRTWRALEAMLQSLCLPLASRGVNVLDVGTGPGPSTSAIADFYSAVTEYARLTGDPHLQQPTSITAVEMTWENNAFRSRFREATLATSTESFVLDDARSIDPRQMRARVRENLLDECEYNPETGTHEPVVWPETADLESQGLYRYRLITLSNFLTNPEILDSVRASLSAIFSDLQPGSVVLNIGGVGKQYPRIYERLDQVAFDSGLQRKIEGVRVASTAEDTSIIVESARRVAQHVSDLSPMPDDVPEDVQVALSQGSRWGGRSAIRVYRRNRRRVDLGPTSG